ncbi:inositol monophosphatase family protein [Taibaiella koreensis]|uniref:inositol monophosphatase family protein n=1 Tax=Taibaiella koreensis TaxID=1268548 RepID=UPI000E59FC7D|nr:inositol monophosphatase family protein [Taibaiella koreensis]
MKETLLNAIKEAGTLILKHFNGTFAVSHKEGINNLVTEVDQASERLITSIIRERYPDHGIIGEEYGAHDASSRYKWIIDPIDGTVNYAHGIPLCCVSIGLMEDETMILGAVYNPMMNELFFAEKGKGAWLNDRPISVSEKSDFAKAFLVTGFPYHFPEGKNPFSIFERMVTSGIPVRRLGSAALDLCWVACGRFDGFWEYNLNAWDIAAGYLIVEEAGGKVTDFRDNPYTVWDKETLATNGKIHEELRQAIIA